MPEAEYPLEFAHGAEKPAAGKAVIDGENVSIFPSFGEPVSIPLRDIASIDAADYRITLTLSGGGSLVLSSLGRGFEDFQRELCRKRNGIILKDMLMDERMVMGGVRADYARTDEDGKRTGGKCEARVYETALVILPDGGELARLPFCELASMGQDGFSLLFKGEYGDSLALSMMGRQLDPFRKALSDALGALSLRTQKMLKDAAPGATAPQVAAAEKLMRDGKAAARAELDAISPAMWEGLVGMIRAAGLKDEYSALEGMSVGERMRIGVKRSLMGDMEGQYIWVLAPIRGKNAVAMEATSSEDSGRATYVFRFMDEGAYAKASQAERDAALDYFMKDVNRCMIAINFRREPIYLDDEALAGPKYSAYRFSILRLPRLRRLRSLFKGRAAHNESWAGSVDALAGL